MCRCGAVWGVSSRSVKHVRPTWAWRPATAKVRSCISEDQGRKIEAQIVGDAGIEEAMRLAAEMGEQDPRDNRAVRLL